MDLSALFSYLHAVSPISEEDKRHLTSIVKPVSMEKGEYWIKEGTPHYQVSFVKSGYLRKYFNKEGVEVTDSFYFSNDLCADLPSLIGKTLPLASVIAMKPSELLVFSYEEFNVLCRHSISLEHLHRVLLEQTFLRFYNRTTSFVLKKPHERYDDLVKTHSHILEMATQYHIASYLGIGPQHLSRLRSRR